MGWGTALRALGRYVQFGKQIGKTAANGTKVYKRGKTLTGVDKNGNVIRQVKTVKTGPNQTKTISTTPIPFSSPQENIISEHTVSQTPEGTIFWGHKYKIDDLGRRRNVYDTPWWIAWEKNRKTGHVDGYKDINNSNSNYGTRIKFHN